MASLPLVARVASVITLLATCACRRETPSEKPGPARTSIAASAVDSRALVAYADIAHATYADAAAGAEALLAEIDRFLAAPSAEGLAAARTAWIRARRPYLQSEVFRFYDGPIDRVETLVNTWPIDESYVEAGIQAPKPGIVEDAQRYPSLSPALLTQLNASEGETSISTGYHVVEYLLWGRDTRADGPGDRPFTDYVKPNAFAARRASYLHISAELLASELRQVRDEWAPEKIDNYRAKFSKLPPLSALGLVLKGAGSLSGPELSGERLTVPYETKDQENEHSCFSDTTQLDLVDDALGLENVCLGRYERVDGSLVSGPGLVDVLAERDPALAVSLRQQAMASLDAARRVPAPFDQAILGNDAAPGRVAIQATITALQRLTESLAKAASVLDIRLSLANPRGQP